MPDEAGVFFTTQAQRIIRLISEPHAAGPGYELDTRLRPSGSQGMLVTSIEAFARYHGLTVDGQKRNRVRPSRHTRRRHGNARRSFAPASAPATSQLGERAVEIAERAAYEAPAPAPDEVHRLRERMERELGRETPERFDLKAGRGGLLDVELAVQSFR